MADCHLIISCVDHRSPTRLIDLPDEILLNIAEYLLVSVSSKCNGFLNSVAQTCRRLRNIAYPLVNRHLLFDEGRHHPDVLLNMVLYSLQEPLADIVKSATFRLRAENEFYLATEFDDIIEEKLPVIRELLKQRAADGNEAFMLIESQIEEYRMATLATIMLYQMNGLEDLELAASTTAMSSRFLLTIMHYFKPPFELNRLGIHRLVNFDSANYFLLERFLRLGVRCVGIDHRFGSTYSHRKMQPPKSLCSDTELETDTDEVWDNIDFDDDRSEKSIEEDFKEFQDYCDIVPPLVDVHEELEMCYYGHKPVDHTVV
ncbi:hypothetical protein ABW20_dc0103322 [Dactylellina cionopaga]|nr:hypothetical protein ABW20_dc0103322 [Dactylellina cionopaga]